MVEHPTGAPGVPIVHVLGTRPNFVKAAPVVAALARAGQRQRLVHTGQHYDPALSEVFFAELGLPRPEVNLAAGSGSHAAQTAALLVGLEQEFLAVPPRVALVYGDVNSTLAAALVAAKLRLPLAHVEAGLRSFDRSMPEEINRRVTDVLADLHFVTSPEAIAHLAAEGVDPKRIHLVGNPMIDTLLANLERLDPAAARAEVGLPERYAVATVHRPSNVDDPASARRLVGALHDVARTIHVVIPLHPRGRAALAEKGLTSGRRLRVLPPMGYRAFLSLVRGAALVVTDSGGLQEEATVLGVPCLTVRPNTERPVTLTHGTNELVTPEGLAARAAEIMRGDGGRVTAGERPPLWDGRAGERIAEILRDWLAVHA
ncbi:MAG: UDP-N-acetylglucosamine 2-epimerase (non-hydrolyzing) [Nitriliruptorales bacterium]|nr:UDP-N-acetylglucosamine 2-epimerase (non-hydrolyzing) [Nitriliruptorales bacterium]